MTESTRLSDPDSFARIAAFALHASEEIPDTALQMGASLLLDTIGVAAGAVSLEAGRIARDFALDFYGASNDSTSARLLFDGRRASLAGAAYAAATQIDNLDAHDGYNPTKGHIGCAVVPALFAFAETNRGLSGRDALSALVISYEIAARTGIALHQSVSDYHTSGAWNALGVAALGCRLMGSDNNTLRQAFGIAEYHGPRSQMMREIDNPTMLHDGSGVGALTGVSAALLASRGFRGAPALTVEAEDLRDIWQDLAQVWTIEANYIKPYPICRWAHAAIDSARALMLEHDFTDNDVAAVEVRTFHEASRLFPGMPETTSHAQYSLAFAVALMLRHGRIAPEHVAGAALTDQSVAELVGRITVIEDERHNIRFPASRWSDVTVTLSDGRRLASGDIHARGGLESPMTRDEVLEKFHSMTAQALEPERSRQIESAAECLLKEGIAFSHLSDLVYPPARGLT
ncbi:MmgE/PrpD family protein [Pelagibius sp. Alg239-R121]|uniref:MmgE/PrpD family protein n=1 Tax=Pelagibius sp. Alg239-R121 TaxID=2993448 RepID=UPI0024A73181|nr:MmgE/PrpD family protein [Pelagibius sp. Alg239-R121]